MVALTGAVLLVSKRTMRCLTSTVPVPLPVPSGVVEPFFPPHAAKVNASKRGIRRNMFGS
jgi:hypothetical protein